MDLDWRPTLGSNHLLVRLRDRAALASWAVEQAAKDFRYFAYLVVAVWGQLGILGQFGLREYWWLVVGGTAVGGVAYVAVYHLVRMPRERERQEANRKGNYMDPKRVIELRAHALLFDRAFDMDGELIDEMDGYLAEHVRGIDMRRFDDDPRGVTGIKGVRPDSGDRER